MIDESDNKSNLRYCLGRLFFLKQSKPLVAARLITTARFATKVTKHAAMPARFVANEVETNRAGIAPSFSVGYQYI